MASTIKNVNKIYQIISESIEDLIFLLNEKLICEYTNFKESTEMKHLSDYIHPKDSKNTIRVIKNIFAEGYGTVEARIRHDKNQFRWYQVKGKRLVDDDNERKVLLICKDITNFLVIQSELKDSQIRYTRLAETLPEIKYWKLLQSKDGIAAVQKSREMLELIINNIPQLIYWKDKNLSYLGCNVKFAKLNNLEKCSSIIRWSSEDIVWLEEKSDYIDDCEKKVMEYDKPEFNVVELLITVDGKQAWFEINRIPLHDVQDKVAGILVTYEDITERKLADQKLKESEEKYRNLVVNLADIIIEVDITGTVVYVSPQSFEVIGYDPSEIIGKIAFEFIHPEDVTILAELLKKGIETKELISIPTYRIKHKDGSYKFVSARAKSVNINGNERIIGTIRDITKQKQMEKKLEESEENYRMIFEKSPDYIYITDIEGNLLEANQNLLNRIGITLEELQKTNFIQYFAGEDIDTLMKTFKKLTMGNEIKDIEVKARNIHGEIFEYEVNSVPLKKDGKVTKILNLARDITEKKIAEQKLKESESKYRHLFDNSPYAIWLMDESGMIVDCNATITDLLSVLTIEDLIGKHFSEVLSFLEDPDEIISDLKDRFRKFLRGEKVGPLEIQITRADGKKFWLSIQSTLVEVGNKTLTQAIIQDITELKESEEKLRILNKELEQIIRERTNELIESEEKFRHLYESSPYGIVLLNSEGIIIDVNPSISSMFGYKKDDLLGKDYITLLGIYPSETQEALRKLPELLSQGRIIDSKIIPKTIEIYKKDGSRSWVDSELSPIQIGNETFFQINIQDITEKKLAEEKIRESEQQYRTTIDSLGDPLHVVDKDLKIILTNRKLHNWLEELQLETNIFGVKISKAFPFLEQNIFEEYQEVFETGETLVTVETTTIPNQTIITETRKIPIFREGEVEQVITILRDITESKRMENQLKDSEEKYRNMVDNLDVGFYKGEYKGKLLMHNQALNRIMGLEPDNTIVGSEAANFFVDQKVHEKYNNDLDENGYLRNFIAQISRANGEVITVDINAHLLYNAEGIPIEVEGTFADITEKFKLQQELLESEKKLREQNLELMKLDKVKNDFITMAAHELKTPLISISGYTDYILLKHRNRLSPEITEDLVTVKRNIKRLEILMDQLLEVLKIDEDELIPQKEHINVRKIINDCLDELSYLINEKNLEINLDINHEIMMKVDPERIFTVFTNLVSNAIKFTPDYGLIEITAKKHNDKYIFEVRDNGIGLNKDDLEKLFKKFERIEHRNLDENINVINSGTGLGLYITKGIINAHGGEIWAKSEGRNKGCTFTFELPI